MRAFSLLGIIGILGLLSSCSKDDVDSDMFSTSSFEIVSSMTCFDEHMSQTRAGGYESMTRAWSIPDGYTAYEDGPQTIGICFTKNDSDPKKGHFFTGSESKWRTNVTGIENTTYYLYGYIPHVGNITCNITDRDGTNANYSAGAIMTLSDVPSVMPGDFCVVIGAKQGFDKDHDGLFIDTNTNSVYDEGVDTRTDRLRQGDFAYQASSSATGNYVFLLFDHLYAALRVKMRVHGDYNALRTIKLKSLKLCTKVGSATITKNMDIRVELKKTENASESPIVLPITYTQKGAENSEGLVCWSSGSGVELNTDYQAFTGHFMPESVTTLILTSTYDIYDKKGNLIREDCEATNTMYLSELFSEQDETHRGSRYTVNMTIQPTYLYVMSDPDLDNPSVVIN